MEKKENIRQNIKVFHCNEKEVCETFLKKDDYLIWSGEKGIWLGSGMYFWDNLSNAKYWKRQKQKQQYSGKTFQIVSAHIYIDHLLDLSDKEHCDKIEDLWKLYCRLATRPYTNVPLGEKLNTLFGFGPFQKRLSYYNVIKIIGKYHHTPPSKLYYYDITKNNAEPTLAAKCIYNVKDPNCIFNKELIKE